MATTRTNNVTTENLVRQSTLHVFCIGGSGLRILRSLIMLLASGYDIKGYKIKPYLVDPHLQSKELSEVSDLIAKYHKLYYGTNNGFFKTPIEADINNLNVMTSTNVNDKSFGTFIGSQACQTGSPESMLIEMLYSKKNIETSMSVGFKGSPNVGSVVFQDFVNSKWFSSFQPAQNDRVILVGSLFGGTGASGIPAIADAIKKKSAATKVGVIALIPYFALGEPAEYSQHREINSEIFDIKSFAALKYYADNANSFDRFYVFGDTEKKVYNYDEESQGNDAHIIELAASQAFKDFAEEQDTDLTPSTRWNQIVIDTNKPTLNYDDCGEGLKTAISCLSDFYSFSKVFFLMQRETFYPFYRGYKGALDTEDFKTLNDFIYEEDPQKYSFIRFMGELHDNKRAFNAIDTRDIISPENDVQLDHYRFVPSARFHLLNRDRNGADGTRVISSQFVKINDSYRRSLKKQEEITPVSAFLNAAQEGIREVNVKQYTANLK